MTNTNDNLHWLTIHETASLLRSGDVTCSELTAHMISRIHAVDPLIRAFTTINDTPTSSQAPAPTQAQAADLAIQAGDTDSLIGIPSQIKDNICTLGIRTTCGSRMLEDFYPPYNATVITKLLNHHAVILGKGNMDEFAMGSSTENSAFYPTHNPWGVTKVPGGSSGGPAAAVAAGECMYALASDTGGSIRQPAALCGVVGLKPTYGLVSRYGLIAFASSLDQIGPITRDVTDTAIVLNAIAGGDAYDSTSISRPTPDYLSALIPDVTGLRVGVPTKLIDQITEPGVRDAIESSIKLFEDNGALVDRDVRLDYYDYALAVYYILAPAEASANLARYDGVKYGLSADAGTMWEALETTKGLGFGPEVKRRIILGTYALSSGYYDAYYRKAQQARALIIQEFSSLFSRYDVLLAPVTPSTAFELGAKVDDPVEMYLNDVFTIPSNIAGIPSISIPAGFSHNMPVGLQILGPWRGESAVLRAAYFHEQATKWSSYHPTITQG